jgi:hypothetical protein
LNQPAVTISCGKDPPVVRLLPALEPGAKSLQLFGNAARKTARLLKLWPKASAYDIVKEIEAEEKKHASPRGGFLLWFAPARKKVSREKNYDFVQHRLRNPFVKGKQSSEPLFLPN